MRPDAPAVLEYRRSAGPNSDFTVETWSYARLAAEITAMVEPISRLTPDEGVVAIVLPNGVALTAVFLATLGAGRTAFLISPQLSPHEMASAVARAPATLLVTADAVGGTCGGVPVVPVSALRAASTTGQSFDSERAHSAGMYLLSSGTTDMPSVVDRRAAALDAVAENIATHVGNKDGRGMRHDDRVLGVIPQCHSYGVESALMGPLFAGAALVLCCGLDTAFIGEIWRREDITVFPATPSMLDVLARTAGPANRPPPHAVHHAHPACVYSAGARLPGSVAAMFEQRYHAPVGQLYGASEAGSLTFIHGECRPEPTCVGTPLSHVDLRIVDPDERGLVDVPRGVAGEVAVRARSMLTRYVGDSRPCMTDGYWRSGDLGQWDERGRLHITGRRKFLVDVGPEKVNPLEVEAVLREHPGVAECVVTSVAVTETVCRLRAIVIRAEGSNSTGEDLRHFLRERLSAYKVPRMYEFRTDLPRSPTGKVLRREL